MADAPTWITAISTFVIAITAVLSVIYYFMSLKVSIAKDKPLVRAYIKRFKNPSLPPRLFVKNDSGVRADNVTVAIGGRTYGSFSLMANETEDLPFEVTEGLRIEILTYEDIHGNKITGSNIPKTIIVDFGML